MQFTGAVFIGSLTDISLLEALLPPQKKIFLKILLLQGNNLL